MRHLLLIFVSVAHAATRFPRWGVSMHCRDNCKPGDIAMLSKGFKVARVDIWWSYVEKAKGHFKFYDSFIDELTENGVMPMLILNSAGNPHFYNQQLPHDEQTRQEFVNFCLAFMHRYKGRNVIWELWNEPNIRGLGYPGQDGYPAWTGYNYGMLAMQLGTNMQRAGLADETLVGGTAWIDTKFLEDVFATGALEYLDGVTVHPYKSIPENAISDADNFAAVRRLMKKHGHVKPVISGEWGWNTCKQPCTNKGAPLWGNYGVSEYAQAHYLARMFLINWLHDVPSIFYQWHTQSTDPHNFEDAFGVVRYTYHNESYPYEPKPAYKAAVALQTLFGELDKVTQIHRCESCVTSWPVILRGTNSRGWVRYAMWYSSAPVLSQGVNVTEGELSPQKEMSVPVGEGCYKVYDMLGHDRGVKCTRPGPQSSHVILMNVGSDPQYLVPHPKAESSPPVSSAASMVVV